MTRIRMCAALVMVSFVLTAVSSGMAQEKGKRPQGGRTGFGGGSLLTNENVQKELKITDDQKKKIEDIMVAARPSGGTNFRDLSREEAEKAFAEFQLKAQEARKKAEAILSPEQVKRLKELTVQSQGANALTTPEVAAELKLTDDQKGKLQGISDDYSAKRRDLFGGGGFNQETRDKLTALTKEQDDKSLAVLTADQKTQFEKMKGAKADYELPRGFGGGRPGGGTGKAKTNN